MLYNLLYPLSVDYSILNIFKYITFRSAWALVTALAVSILVGPYFIRWLQAIKCRQEILKEVKAHQCKAGTPTMGGLLIVFAVSVSVLLWADLTNAYVWMTMLVFIGFSAVGFIDDFMKVSHHQNKGLSPRAKFAGQMLVAGIAMLLLVSEPAYSTRLAFPFFKTLNPDLGSMLILAFRYMTGCPPEHLKEVMDLFSLTTLEICEGQQLDMEFESRCDVTEDEYIEMIRLKTAVLLAGSLKIGAILAGATAEDAENLYNFGMHIGVAFQLQDDLLDVYGDPEVFGKKIGGDILCNKKTYMLIKALNRADEKQHAELNRWLNAEAFQPSEKIEAVTEIYNQLNIRNICESKMREYYTFAMESLAAVAVAEDRKKELKNLVKLLMYREM